MQTTCGITSLAPDKAEWLPALERAHCTIEDRHHCVRAVTFDEDRSQVRSTSLRLCCATRPSACPAWPESTAWPWATSLLAQRPTGIAHHRAELCLTPRGRRANRAPIIRSRKSLVQALLWEFGLRQAAVTGGVPPLEFHATHPAVDAST